MVATLSESLPNLVLTNGTMERAGLVGLPFLFLRLTFLLYSWSLDGELGEDGGVEDGLGRDWRESVFRSSESILEVYLSQARLDALVGTDGSNPFEFNPETDINGLNELLA